MENEFGPEIIGGSATNFLRDLVGEMDIYLMDQLLKGRLAGRERILDAGCGRGRNLPFFLKNGYDVYAIDRNPEALQATVELAKSLGVLPMDSHYKLAGLEDKVFPANYFDLVICNAVLHFAEADVQFQNMLKGCWHSLKPGGLFFCRLATKIGMDGKVQFIRNGRHVMPDGTVRFLAGLDDLIAFGEKNKGILLEPIKTTDVQGMRSMTTWVLEKQ